MRLTPAPVPGRKLPSATWEDKDGEPLIDFRLVYAFDPFLDSAGVVEGTRNKEIARLTRSAIGGRLTREVMYAGAADFARRCSPAYPLRASGLEGGALDTVDSMIRTCAGEGDAWAMFLEGKGEPPWGHNVYGDLGRWKESYRPDEGMLARALEAAAGRVGGGAAVTLVPEPAQSTPAASEGAEDWEAEYPGPDGRASLAVAVRARVREYFQNMCRVSDPIKKLPLDRFLPFARCAEGGAHGQAVRESVLDAAAALAEARAAYNMYPKYRPPEGIPGPALDVFSGEQAIPHESHVWHTEPLGQDSVADRLREVAAGIFIRGGWVFEAIVFCSFWMRSQTGGLDKGEILSAVREAAVDARGPSPAYSPECDAGLPGIAADFTGLDDPNRYPEVLASRLTPELEAVVSGISKAVQINQIVPLAACIALPSGALHGKVKFSGAEFGRRSTPLSVNVYIGSNSGSGKSTVLEPFKSAVTKWEAEKKKEILPKRTEVETFNEGKKREIKKLFATVESGAKAASEVEPEIQALKKQFKPLPLFPEFFSNDTTNEALLKDLRGNPTNSLCVLADEAKPLQNMMGLYKPSAQIDVQVYCDGFGGASYKNSRVGGGKFLIPQIHVSVAFFFQPDFIGAIVGNKVMGRNGFLQRGFTADIPAENDFQSRELDPDTGDKIGTLLPEPISGKVFDKMTQLLNLEPLPGEDPPDFVPDPEDITATKNAYHYVGFTPAAERLYTLFADSMKQFKKSLPPGNFSKFASRIPEHALRVSAVLACWENSASLAGMFGPGKTDTESVAPLITVDILRTAIYVTRLFTATTGHACARHCKDASRDAGEEVLEWMAGEWASGRDATKARLFEMFGARAEADPRFSIQGILEELLRKKLVRKGTVKSGKKGRPGHCYLPGEKYPGGGE
jgi:hypothetical protein